MKTITYDETEWQLVPVEATEEMIDAMLSDREGNSFERLHLARDYKAALYVAPTPPSSVNWEDDALSWGGALNDAAWAFIEACPEKSTLLFNSAKASLRQAILVYGQKVGSSAISEDIEALRKDAERYRWLRFRVSAHGVCDAWEFGFPTYRTLPAPPMAMRTPDAGLDEAIDAAMAAGGE